MQSNQNNTYHSQDNVDGEENLIPIQAIDRCNYLYPNGHRMPPQMSWFKGSRNRALKTDISA